MWITSRRHGSSRVIRRDRRSHGSGRRDRHDRSADAPGQIDRERLARGPAGYEPRAEVTQRISPWAYPENRYYYEWYDADEDASERSDGRSSTTCSIRSGTGPYVDQYEIDVDVKKS